MNTKYMRTKLQLRHIFSIDKDPMMEWDLSPRKTGWELNECWETGTCVFLTKRCPLRSDLLGGSKTQFAAKQ